MTNKKQRRKAFGLALQRARQARFSSTAKFRDYILATYPGAEVPTATAFNDYERGKYAPDVTVARLFDDALDQEGRLVTELYPTGVDDDAPEDRVSSLEAQLAELQAQLSAFASATQAQLSAFASELRAEIAELRELVASDRARRRSDRSARTPKPPG